MEKKTRIHIIIISILAVLFSCIFCAIKENDYKTNPDYEYNEVTRTEPRVYVTNTGDCYHHSSCGSLYKSSIPMGRDEAREKGYFACSRCGGRSNGTITTTYKIKEEVPFGAKHVIGQILLAVLTAPFVYMIGYVIYEVYIEERRNRTSTPTSQPTPPKVTPPKEPLREPTEREIIINLYERLSDDSIEALPGKMVTHKQFGKGVISFVNDRKYIGVYFEDINAEKKFVFPDAFADKYLMPLDFEIVDRRS